MVNSNYLSEILSEFISYLIGATNSDGDRIPPLSKLSKELNVSTASLREQLEVARALGLVEVKPRTGIRRLPYSFLPAVQQSLAYAVSINEDYFYEFSDMRNHIETSYWYKAVILLTDEDKDKLKTLVRRAREKLSRPNIQIPHQEHKELHLTIFSRLNNTFVKGLLEAYWVIYEEAGLDVYTDITYLESVWNYHEKIVDAICAENYTVGYQAMLDHMDLLQQRPKTNSRQRFE